MKLASTTLSENKLNEYVQTLDLKKPGIIMLDACNTQSNYLSDQITTLRTKTLTPNSTTSEKYGTSRSDEENQKYYANSKGGSVVINSSRPGERSVESKDLQQSVFTHHLLETLSNTRRLDEDMNMEITLNEFINVLEENTNDFSEEEDLEQIISIDINM